MSSIFGTFVERSQNTINDVELAEKGLLLKPKNRIRSNDAVHTVSATGSITHENAHSPPSGGPGGTIRLGVKRLMTDVVTPRYRALRRTGKLINNAAYSLKEEFSPSSSTVLLKGTLPGSTQCQATFGGYLGAQFETPTSRPLLGSDWCVLTADNRLINKLSIDLFGKVEAPKTLSLVTAAEMHKTFDLIAGNARKLALLVTHAKRLGSYRGACNILGRTFKRTPKEHSAKTAGNKWLEWRYGWGPTLMDINGTLQAMSVGDFVQPYKIVRGYQSYSARRLYEDPTWLSGNLHPSLGEWRLTYEEKLQHDLRGYLMYAMNLKYSSARAFGIDSLASTAWELIPFSFVVDWIIPVGDWIQAIEPKVGVDILMAGYTQKSITTLNRVVTDYRNVSGDPHGWVQVIPYQGHKDTYIRTIFSRFPYLPYPQFPSIDVKLNKKRVTDSIALLVGSLSRK